MGARAVERADQDQAVAEALGGLMELERRLLEPPPLQIAPKVIEKLARAGEPLLVIFPPLP
jgi:hypothetical protein